MNTRGIPCPHPDRPQALLYASPGDVHVCAECIIERGKRFVPDSWDHQSGPNDVAPDGRQIHFKEPTYEWRKQ